MVNSGAAMSPDAVLVDVRNRALMAAGAAVAILDASVPEKVIVWVNDAFTAATGYTLDQVRGCSPQILRGAATDRVAVLELSAAVRDERSTVVTVLCYRSDGRPFWNHVTLSPVRDDDGVVTHWVAVQIDVTSERVESAEQRREVEVERRARTELSIVAQISDLVMDLDDPHALEEIARQLCRGMVEWAAFFFNDNGLRAAEGIDVQAPPTGRGRRHGSGSVVHPAAQATVHTSDTECASTAKRDRVQELLDGVREGPVDLDLTGSYPLGTASHWLSSHLHDELTHLGATAVVLLPVAGRRRVLGVLAIVPVSLGGAADIPENVLTVLGLTVRRVGLAVDNVRLYAREHALAETLQRAMLPQQAQVDGLDLWTYYSPNADHAQVGGDWYDVMQVSSDVVAVVIGDVVGHDVEAAAAMGQLRSVVRSFAFAPAAPGEVLERVDQLVAGMTIPRAASLVLMKLTRQDGSWALEYSRAGHLPVMLVRDGSTHLLDGAGGPLIGFGGSARPTAQHDLLPGDVLLFYTDGLIERRDRPLREGLAALEEVAAGITAIDSAGIGEDLIAGLVDEPEDDVAVVVVRLPDHGSDDAVQAQGRLSRRWLLPSEPASIGRAREAVVRTCLTWQLPEAGSAELVVSELMANAVLHGWGPISLRLFDTGDGLRIEVEDANPAPPVTTDGHPGRVGGYGMRIVERLADWGWRPLSSGKLVWARMRTGGLDDPEYPAGDPA